MVLASVAKLEELARQVRENRKQQLLIDKEHNRKTRYVPGNFGGNAKRRNPGIGGPSIGGFQGTFGKGEGESRYGIQRDEIDGLF